MVNESINMQAATKSAATSKVVEEFSLLDLLIVLSQGKLAILTVTMFCAVLAIIFFLLLPARITATVAILPPQHSSSISSVLSAQLGTKNPDNMYVTMFKNQTVEDAAIQHYGLMQEYHNKLVPDTAKSFESNAKIDDSVQDGLIHISVADRGPHCAAEFTNGYAEQFCSLFERMTITEEALKNTAQEGRMISVDSQSRAQVESAASLRAQIVVHGVEIQGMRTYATG
jgi:capsular polysaccharide biosynthesis protein